MTMSRCHYRCKLLFQSWSVDLFHSCHLTNRPHDLWQISFCKRLLTFLAFESVRSHPSHTACELLHQPVCTLPIALKSFPVSSVVCLLWFIIISLQRKGMLFWGGGWRGKGLQVLYFFCCIKTVDFTLLKSLAIVTWLDLMLSKGFVLSNWWRVFMWRMFLSKPSPCGCFEHVSCGFSDTLHHPGRRVRRKARNGYAPIQLEACKTLAVSPRLFLLQLCLHLQLENITFPTWVNAVSLHRFSRSRIES